MKLNKQTEPKVKLNVVNSYYIATRLIVSVLILFYLAEAGISYFFKENLQVTLGFLVGAIVLGVSFFTMKKTGNLIFVRVLILLTVLLLSLLKLYLNDNVLYFLFLAVLVPFSLLFLIKSNTQAIWLNIIVLFLLIFAYLSWHKESSLEFIARFALYYILSSAIVHFFRNLIYKQIQFLEKNRDNVNDELEAQQNFLKSFSYQLRTPLNNIIGLNDFFARTELDDIQQDYLDTIAASAFTLLDVIEILDKQNNVIIDKNADEAEKIRFNIYLTLNNFIDFTKSQNKGLEIELKIDDNFPSRVIGNPIKLKQILFLIFESFKKYNSEKQLSIQIELKADSVSEDIVHYNFLIKKIGKLHILKTEELTGKSQDKLLELLDIRLAKELCRLLGCNIYIEIDEEFSLIGLKGQFEIVKRQVEDKYYKDKEDRLSQNVTISDGVSEKLEVDAKLKNANVLLVEDNLINQKVILLALETEVSNIDVANNGKEALDAFGKTKYDIILMDIQMPIMDGIKAAQKIREIEKSTNSYTPIIAVTANALQGDRNTCMEAGMDEYITKPIQIVRLKTIMSQLVGK